MSATSVAAFLRRDLLLLRRNTASLISMFVVPPLFLLCLYAVFGYSAGQSGFGYLRFVLGGCLFQAAMFTAAASAMAVGQDVESGLVDRVRVLPGATGGYVAGRLVTDVLRIRAWAENLRAHRSGTQVDLVVDPGGKGQVDLRVQHRGGASCGMGKSAVAWGNRRAV